MQKKLGLSDHEYQVAVTVTYMYVTLNVLSAIPFTGVLWVSPYILSDTPAALLLRKIGPHIIMPTVLTIWGVICALQGKTGSKKLKGDNFLTDFVKRLGDFVRRVDRCTRVPWLGGRSDVSEYRAALVRVLYSQRASATVRLPMLTLFRQYLNLS